MKVTWSYPDPTRVPIAPGVSFYANAQMDIDDYAGYALHAVVTTNEFGNVEVAELTLTRLNDGPPITSEGLRRVKVESIIRNHAYQSIRDHIGGSIQPGATVTGLGMMSTEKAQSLAALGPSPETIEWVGQIYRVAAAIGDPPTRAVEQTFNISRSTAGAWIGRARAAGLIAPVALDRQTDV